MRTIFLSLFFFITLKLSAQKIAIISGQIIDTDNKPVENVTVRLLNTTSATTTNSTGEFKLINIANGSYTIEVSSVGFKAEKQNITIANGKSIELLLELNRIQNTLTEVVVSARRGQRYTEPVTTIGTKTALPVIDIPQSVKVIGRQLIDDRQAIDIQDVYKNASGVSFTTPEGNPTTRGFLSAKPYINGTRSFFLGNEQQLTLVNIEQVEFLKGPSSILYGFAQPGGVLNAVTKKPMTTPRYAASFTAGSYGRFRTDFDATGPLSKDKKLLYRLNIGYQNSPDYRPFHFNKNLTIAPTVSYAVSDKTSVSMEMVYNRVNKTVWYDWGLPPIDGDLYAVPITYSVHEPTDFVRWNNLSLQGDVNHKFNSAIAFYSTVFIASSGNYGEVHAPNYLDAGGGKPDAAGNVPRIFRTIDYNRNSSFITNYFTLNFSTFGVKHKIVAGVDYFKGFSGSTTQGAAGKADSVPTINALKPLYSQKSLKDYRLTTLASRSFGYENSTTEFTGGYVQDNIEVTSYLKFVFALRHDIYKFKRYPANTNIENKPWLPSGAVIIQPLKNTSLYFNASKGFVPQNNQDPLRGGPFDPEISEQLEGGIKHEAFKGRLIASAAVYEVKRTNFLVTDPANPARLLQTGETTANGFEADVIGAITPNLSVNANYSYNVIKITKTTQTNIGSRPTSQPFNLASGWARYNFTRAVKGLGVGIGANYASEGKNAAVVIPSYTYADAALYYTMNKVSLSFNLNNITDKRYFYSTASAVQIYRGMPRNFLLRVAVTY